MASAVFAFSQAGHEWVVTFSSTASGWQVVQPGQSSLRVGEQYPNWSEVITGVLAATSDPLESVEVEGLPLPDAVRPFEGRSDRLDWLTINGESFEYYETESHGDVLLPDEYTVEGAVVLDEASAHWENEGAPVSWDAFESVVRFGDLYYVLGWGDLDQYTRIVGRFPTEEEGRTAAAAVAEHLGEDEETWGSG